MGSKNRIERKANNFSTQFVNQRPKMEDRNKRARNATINGSSDSRAVSAVTTTVRTFAEARGRASMTPLSK